MSETLVIGLIVAVTLATAFAIKKYKIVNGKKIETTVDKATDIAMETLELFNLDTKAEKTIVNILNIADTVAEYVGSLIDSEDKQKLIHKVLDDVFIQLGIKPSENERGLINIVVDEAIKFAEKK